MDPAINGLPNPTRDRLLVGLPTEEILNLQVYDALGQPRSVVRRGQELDVSNLADGVYWLTARLRGGQIWTQSWVKY